MRDVRFGSSISSSLSWLVLALLSAGGCTQEGPPVEYIAQKTTALPSPITIDGMVTDGSGHPQAGVVVAFSQAGAGPVDAGNLPTAATTAADGTYSVELALPGTYDVVATPPATSIYLPQAFAGRSFSGPDTFDIVLLEGSVTVSGKVTTSDGTPLSNQSVSFSGNGATTDSSGNYSVAVVPGDVLVNAGGMINIATGLIRAGSNDGGVPDGGTPIYSQIMGNLSRSVSISGATTLDVVVPTRVITGVVLDPNGDPVAGARVLAQGWTVGGGGAGADGGTGPWSAWMASANTVSDGTGNFRLTVFPGAGTMIVSPPPGSGQPAFQLHVEATDDTAITVNLPSSVLVSGKVTTSDGTPLSNQSVSFSGNGATTDSAGNYSVVVVPGDVLVNAGGMINIATGLIRAGSNDGGVPDGGIPIYSQIMGNLSRSVSISGATTLDVVMPTRVITGVVLDPDGDPVAGAGVVAQGWTVGGGGAGADGGTGPWSAWMASANTVCDGTGNFRLTVFPGAGTLNLAPTPASGLAAYSFPVQALDDKQIGVSIQFVTQTEQATVPADGTVTTDPGTGPTAADPVTTAVTSPNAGEVSITERPIIQAPPSGYSFLTQQIDITAPAATAAHPLVLTFNLDASRVPQGLGASDLAITRNGEIVEACLDDSGSANPDPCMFDRETTPEGDISITVLTSEASAWNFAVPTPDNGTGGSGGSGGSTGGGAGGASGSGGTGGTTSTAATGGTAGSGEPGATAVNAITGGASGSGGTGGAAGSTGAGGSSGSGDTGGTAGGAGAAGASGSGGAGGLVGNVGTAGTSGSGGTGGNAAIDGGAGGTAGTTGAAGAGGSGEDASVADSASELDAGGDDSMPDAANEPGAEAGNRSDGHELGDANVDVVPASDTAGAEAAIDSSANSVDAALVARDGAAGGKAAEKSSGCSCTLAGKQHASALALGWGVLALLLARRVRRRRAE